MRTTVLLDPDVEQLLREAMQRTGQSFETTVNQAIRRGLAGTASTVDESPFEVHAKPMGLRAGIDPTRLSRLADDLEVEAFLEVTRKLADRHSNPPS